jgi:hypothetical protein
MCGIGVKIEVEVILSDRAILVVVYRRPDRGFVFSAIPHLGYCLNYISWTADRPTNID